MAFGHFVHDCCRRVDDDVVVVVVGLVARRNAGTLGTAASTDKDGLKEDTVRRVIPIIQQLAHLRICQDAAAVAVSVQKKCESEVKGERKAGINWVEMMRVMAYDPARINGSGNDARSTFSQGKNTAVNPAT